MAEEISPLEDHGWWMERLRKDAKATRPEAFGYAHCLEARGFKAEATELRRLHAENALLHERHHFDNGVLKELLEALKLAQSIIGHPDDAHSKLIAAAIAKAEGE